jgi:hypothetical protein
MFLCFCKIAFQKMIIFFDYFKEGILMINPSDNEKDIIYLRYNHFLFLL